MALKNSSKKSPKKPTTKKPKAVPKMSPKATQRLDAEPAPTPQEIAARKKLADICREFTTGLSVLAQAERFTAAKPVYEKAYPESKLGGAAGKAGGGKVAKVDRMSAFAEHMAKQIACSARHVRRLVEVGEKLDRDVLKRIRGTKLANRTVDLVDLAHIKEHENQLAAVRAYHSKDGGNLTAFKKVVRKYVKRPKASPKPPWRFETEPIVPETPQRVKLPIGTVLVELLKAEGAFRLRFSQAGQADGREVASAADRASGEVGIISDETIGAAPVLPPRRARTVPLAFPSWASLEAAAPDALVVTNLVEVASAPQNELERRMNASGWDNLSHGLRSEIRRGGLAGKLVFLNFAPHDDAPEANDGLMLARFDDNGRDLLKMAFRLEPRGTVRQVPVPGAKPFFAWVERKRRS